MQSDEWFYDLTAISNLQDYFYEFADGNPETPSMVGMPRVEFVPYQKVVLQCEQRGAAYVLTTLTAWAEDASRSTQFFDYQEIVPGRFRPQRIVIYNGNTSRTEIQFRQWQLNAARPELFTSSTLETRSVTLLENQTEAP